MSNKLYIITRTVFWSFLIMWLMFGFGLLTQNTTISILMMCLWIANPILSIMHLCSIKDNKVTPIWSLVLTALWGVLLI